MKTGPVRQNRLCAFCGQPPDQKTKEHILPQWLIKAAGKPGESVVLGLNKRTGKPLKSPFEQLTLPACAKCNNTYSKLEGATQPIFSKLFEEQDLSVDELITLLDWFDKVRLGLWLWRLAINETPINRRFHITQRMRKKDRVLFVSYFQGQPKGMGFFGTSNFAFELIPSCFGLAVNNLAFVNVSFDYLLAPSLGFPCIENWRLQGQGEPERDLSPDWSRI